MATIDVLPAGKYRVRIRRRGRPTFSKTFTSKDNAAAWARRVESAQERGLAYGTTESASMTLTEALDKYAAEVTPKHRGAINELSMLRARFADNVPAGYVKMFKAMQLLGVSRQTVLQRVKRGELQAVHGYRGRAKGIRIQIPTPTTDLFTSPKSAGGAV